jgi:hypothetical protein
MIVRAMFWLGHGWRGKAFAVVCGIVGLAAMLSVIIPYNPYTSYELRVEPDKVCAPKYVNLITTREWRETWYQNIETAHVASQWRDVKTGAIYPAFNGPSSPTLSQPRGTVKADIKIPVPRAYGTYRLYVQYNIEGGIMLAPRHQDVPADPDEWLTSVNTVVVKACP